ncbi:hypothetical protein N0V92_003974 [Colletotrichum tropicale]|nr:hypothetical protein N0V92_003974 [Colletotrichum tropicale]
MNYDTELYRNDAQHFDDPSIISDQLSPTYYNNDHASSPSHDFEQSYTYQDDSENAVQYDGSLGDDTAYQQSYQDQPESENDDGPEPEPSLYDPRPDHGYESENQYHQHMEYASEINQDSEEPGDNQSDEETDEQGANESDSWDGGDYPSGNSDGDGENGDNGVYYDDDWD